MIISLVIFFALLILFLPQDIKFNLHFTCDRLFANCKKINNMPNYIQIKFLGILPIYKMDVFKKINKNKDKKNNNAKKKNKHNKNNISATFSKTKVIKGILNKVNFKQFVLSLGFNTRSCIANSYINASLNTLLCMYINSNQRRFKMNKLFYQTYISDNLFVLNFDGILSISIADTIYIILKEYFNLLKKKKFKQKILIYERRNYGNTSN